MTTTCYVYRCSAKADMYIYLAEENNFDCIDKTLQNKLGQLQFAMMLELSENKKLAKEDPVTVIKNLQQQGFHLQLPPQTSVEEILEKIAENQIYNEE